MSSLTNCIGGEIASQTKYKTLKSAYENHEFEVIVFPRDGAWQFQGILHEKTYEYLQKEMKKLYPDYHQI